MTLLVALPVPMQLLYEVNGRVVHADLIQVRHRRTTTVLCEPPEYKDFKFNTVHAAVRFVVDMKANAGASDFAIDAAKLNPQVFELCRAYGQLCNPRFRDQDASRPLFVELKLLLYLEFMLLITFSPAPQATAKHYRLPKKSFEQKPNIQRAAVTVIVLRRHFDLPNFVWGRHRSENHFRHVSRLPDQMNKRCSLDIQHANGYRDAINCLRRSTLGGLIRSPKDFWAAYWMPWQLSHNFAEYSRPLSDDFPESGVLPLDVEWELLLKNLDLAWCGMSNTHRLVVFKEWLSFSVSRCHDGPALMQWWARDFEQSCPEIKDHAISILFSRAKELDGHVDDDNWVMGSIQQYPMELMSKAKPTTDESGDTAWYRLKCVALALAVTDSKTLVNKTKKRLKR